MPFGSFNSYGSSSFGTGRSGDGSAGGTAGGLNDSRESNNYQGLSARNQQTVIPREPRPPAYDFTVDLDSFLDPNRARSIADGLLQQQYASSLLPFQNQMQRGTLTPEAFRLAQGNLDQQRSTLGNTYEQTALGELTRGKTTLQDALTGYRRDPTSLQVGEGMDFNTALQGSLRSRADEFMGGFNDNLYNILSTQNPFSAMPAQQAALSGRGVTGGPIANILSERNQNTAQQRRIGDRIV